MKVLRRLQGHSGCEVLLMQQGGRACAVRKISADYAYNPRLKLQCEKQDSYKNFPIKTPRILSEGMLPDGRYYFDMEYVSGISLAKHMQNVPITDIVPIANRFASSILENLETSEDTADVSIFEQKIASIKKKTEQLKNPLLSEALDLLSIHDWSAFRPSMCHGDMTLENILVRGEELYFIDFLDSFYESAMIDVGALLQDVHCMWSYRYQKKLSTNLKVRLMIFRDRFRKMLSAGGVIKEEDMWYSLLMKLVRIYPYVKDEVTRRFLDHHVGLILEQLNGGSAR